MAQVTQRQKPGLPQQWAEEIALATTSEPRKTTTMAPSGTASAETLGGPVFDKQLDGFLDRFQQEIVSARALKDDLDRVPPGHSGHDAAKEKFKKKMDRIRALFATEGEDFVSCLEKRNPKLTMAACGENTIELAQGIERLETAVKEEETKRSTHAAYPDRNLHRELGGGDENVSLSNITPPSPSSRDHSLHATNGPASVGQTLSNLNSDETLQLMQSDIQALKLELMRLQRSKANANPFPSSAPLSLPPTKPLHPLDSNQGSAYSIDSLSPDNKDGKGLPPSLLANNVNVVRVTGRANGFAPTYVSHLEQMKSRLEALEKKPLSRRAKSAARLGRTQTMGSLYENPLADENQHPNVSAMVTPPRSSRRMKHRSISTQSPHNYSRLSPPPGETFVQLSSPGPSPSPPKPSMKKSDAAQNSATPARLFFDAPEEMLSRPQSHAAARDIQRYSLKVARRLGPSEPVGGNVYEPRAKSAVTVSPTRRQATHNESVSIGHTMSDVGATANAGSPSTIDTNGSGGRVVEEIEGDMWVRKGVVWKRWRRRYASIVSHQFFGKVMCLFSYDSNGGVISTRSQIVVLHSSLCRAVREKVEIGGQERFMFVLRTSSKEYYFAAETDEVRRNWIRELRDAARKDNSRFTNAAAKGRSMAFKHRLGVV